MIPEINVGDVYRVTRVDITMVYLVTGVDTNVHFTFVYTKSGEVFTDLHVSYRVFSAWTRKSDFNKL